MCNAVHVMRIATGEEIDHVPDGKSAAAEEAWFKGREEGRRQHDAGAARGDR
ncbi:hypothetical protein [Mesorhizobium sp. CA5]|uniref:hypothetical protein n=1 Tax=Mesorhizobium sp. CA5 TaxID=2876638 RepID=UPI001CD04D63|nr:hypothetical protein [Mesorhizobium sp. CA5]MBZ9844075.1 hypothetical protein [Mesorhizobium sp. CA5]